MENQERLALINENLAEVLNPELIERPLKEGRNPRIYWGTATTGKPHCAYLLPAIKIAQFLSAGCEVVILLADIHGMLDNLKAPIELVKHRAEFYRLTIASLLKAVGISMELKNLTFVLGSSYQTSPEYVLDVYKLSSSITEHEAKRAGAEVVKQTSSPPISGLLYPILQVLDEQYLDVDAQFGGLDQRKLFIAAKEWLPKLGYRERCHLLSPMLPGLVGGKMSSSEPESKIDLLEPPEGVIRKIRKAPTVPKVIEENGILALVEFVLFPAAALSGHKEFRVERDRDNLEPLIYTSIEPLHEDYKNDILTPQLLKPAVAAALNKLLAPIQEEYLASPHWQEIALKAYPPEPKKEKKVKKLGTQHPKAKKDDTKGPEDVNS